MGSTLVARRAGRLVEGSVSEGQLFLAAGALAVREGKNLLCVVSNEKFNNIYETPALTG